MDVFFCDLCGARVTDTDLSAGQGQRKGFDVICAGCIHQGQGRSWSKARDERRSIASQRIDAARDRAATLDEDDGPAQPPTSIVVAEPEPEVVTTRVEPSQGLSDMAGGMAAMAMASAPAAASALERDDGLVEVDDLDDGVVEGGGSPVRDTAATAPVVNPAIARDQDRRKTSNRMPARTPSPQPKSGRSAKSGKSSTTTRATAKGGSGKRRAQVGTGQWVLFGVAIAVLVVLGGLTVYQLGKSRKPVGEVVVKDAALQGKEAVADAVRQAQDAISAASGSRDAAKLQAALDAIRRAGDAAERFETNAVASWTKQGRSQEEAETLVGQELNRLRVPDVRMQRKLINDELARLK